MSDVTDKGDEKQGATAVEAAKPKEKTATSPKTSPRVDKLPPFNVVLLNDDVHTYDYVILMLGELFGHPPEKGFELAKVVDTSGKAIVMTTHREHAELKRDQIMAFGADTRVSACKSSMRAVVEPGE